MGKIRGANHHGRGKGGKAYSPRHIDRNKLKEAQHIDPARTPNNRYWMWRGEWQQPGDCEAAERAYYREAFAEGQEAQNERYRRKGNHSRVRTTDQVYDVTTTSPEGTLLYIGSRKDGLVDPADLWACGMDYLAWEQAALGDYYKPLTLGMHLDEDGQYHLELRSVYQYQDADGHWRPGQNAALEAAGVPLPDPSKPRDKSNNRKMTWDAARREAWLDVLEAHGYQVERVPEKERPHMGLKAWQAWQDAQADLDTQATAQAALQASLDTQARKQAQVQQTQQAAAQRIGQQLRELEATRAAQDARAAQLQREAQAVQAARDAIPQLVQEAIRREIEAARAAQPPRRPNAQRAAQDAIRQAQEAAQNVRQPGQRNGPGKSL